MLGAGDSERVAELIREVAAAELLPRFRNLSKDEIRLKGPGDPVTVADVASEQRLASGLARILPGVPVVGEEAAEKDADLVELIGRPDGACWIVDPLDGTANFAAGKDAFAIIVALVRDRQTIAGWILDVPGNRLAVAIKGQGITLDGKQVPRCPDVVKPNGYVGYKVRRTFDRELPDAQRGRLGKILTLRCAGHEYINILGRTSFSLYRQTKPWDHAAGALMLTEAGGDARAFDGKPYAPDQNIFAGIIGSTSTAVLEDVRSVFEAARMPLLAELD
jgi:fructose-1,6-bisphosphatase/inositol monophosphatase family enzyme